MIPSEVKGFTWNCFRDIKGNNFYLNLNVLFILKVYQFITKAISKCKIKIEKLDKGTFLKQLNFSKAR